MSERLVYQLAVTQGSGSPVVPATAFSVRGLAQTMVEITLDSDGGTLSAVLEFLSGVELAASLAVGGLQQTVNQTGWSHNGSNTITFTNPPAGQTRMLLRFPTQPRLMNTRWTLNSGAAIFTLKTIFWGFGQGTTP